MNHVFKSSDHESLLALRVVSRANRSVIDIALKAVKVGPTCVFPLSYDQRGIFERIVKRHLHWANTGRVYPFNLDPSDQRQDLLFLSLLGTIVAQEQLLPEQRRSLHLSLREPSNCAVLTCLTRFINPACSVLCPVPPTSDEMTYPPRFRFAQLNTTADDPDRTAEKSYCVISDWAYDYSVATGNTKSDPLMKVRTICERSHIVVPVELDSYLSDADSFSYLVNDWKMPYKTCAGLNISQQQVQPSPETNSPGPSTFQRIIFAIDRLGRHLGRLPDCIEYSGEIVDREMGCEDELRCLLEALDYFELTQEEDKQTPWRSRRFQKRTCHNTSADHSSFHITGRSKYPHASALTYYHRTHATINILNQSIVTLSMCNTYRPVQAVQFIDTRNLPSNTAHWRGVWVVEGKRCKFL